MVEDKGLVLLTGMQPSGSVHIGNYFGSLDNVNRLQQQKNIKKAFFMIADLHSLNTTPSRDVLQDQVLASVATLYGCGVSAVVFLQSTVSAHAELAVILATITSIGKLQRMTQFKVKTKLEDSASVGDFGMNSVNLGLLSYPVLQAADILLYDVDVVPVGADQKQHLELTRDIVQSFHFIYGREVFKMPEPLIDNDSGKIMSLSDGTKKMSKSSDDVMGCLYLTDDSDVVAKKIKKAKTDSISEIYYDPNNRPEVSNLINTFSLISGKSIDEIVIHYRSSSMDRFKKDLIDATIQKFRPMKISIEEYKKDRPFLIEKLKEGMNIATTAASFKINAVKDAVGLLRL